MSTKKVLIIAYYWPPAGGPGVQRWLKFVKYLPEFGIKPIVYVPENPSYPITDSTLVSEIPKEITILKQPIREPYGWASTLSRKRTTSISSGILTKGKKQTLIEKLLLYIRGNFFIPDARVGWVKPSITYLKDCIETHHIDTIITTGPPHSLHLIGNGLKKWRNDLTWFADFRDPWTSIGYHDKLKMTLKTKAIHKHMEREVLNDADHIIVTSPSTREEFLKITERPITVITNGYDDSAIIANDQSSKFVLAHIGSLLSDRDPQILWKVLADLAQENIEFSKDFILQLVGKVSSEVVESIKIAGLSDFLELSGYVSHQEAQQLQKQATALLLIEINATHTKGIIAGKLFEYLSARKPIIAIGPSDADVEAIIKETSSGTFVDYDETKKLKQEILKIYEAWKTGSTIYSGNGIEKYHRRNLTKQLAKILKRK